MHLPLYQQLPTGGQARGPLLMDGSRASPGAFHLDLEDGDPADQVSSDSASDEGFPDPMMEDDDDDDLDNVSSGDEAS